MDKKQLSKKPDCKPKQGTFYKTYDTILRSFSKYLTNYIYLILLNEHIGKNDDNLLFNKIILLTTNDVPSPE